MKQIKSADVKEVRVNGMVVELVGVDGKVLETINAGFEELVPFVVESVEFQIENEECFVIDDVKEVSGTKEVKITETEKIKSADVKEVRVNGTMIEIVGNNNNVITTVDAQLEDFVSFIVEDIMYQKENKEYITVVV
jgi:hypothetical protein